jgi:flavin reductase (DIM6/NTAB) family NADH-FMN oxidoreductase RutF
LKANARVSASQAPGSNFLALAKYLACPVAFITAVNKQQRSIMVGTATYVALEPLLLSVNVHAGSSTGKAILASGRFGISIASHEQLDLVRKLSEAEFSKEIQMGADKFDYLGIEPLEFKASSTLYLSDSLASFDCEVVKSVECAGIKTIVGVVQRTASGAGVRPLIRYDRSYGHFTASVIGGDSYPI